MSAALSQLEREAARILERLRRLEEIPVPSAAKLLKKSPEWVRANLPVIIHGPNPITFAPQISKRIKRGELFVPLTRNLKRGPRE